MTNHIVGKGITHTIFFYSKSQWEFLNIAAFELLHSSIGDFLGISIVAMVSS